MKSLICLVLALFALASPARAEPWQLLRSDVQTVVSPEGHAYRLLVAWPEGKPPKEGWPVLWVLDGEDNFAIAALTARRLARARERSGVAPGLVVAIDPGPLARRVLDLTPPAPGYAIPPGLPAHGLAVGGADAFMELIDRQLRPALARQWRIDTSRETLLGHSFGGLFGLHALFTDRTFEAIAAISPSLWYGDNLVERAERAAVANAPARLLIASGSDEGGPNAHSGAAAEALVARWRNRGADARFLSLEGHGHGATMLAAMAAAVTFAFGEGKQ